MRTILTSDKNDLVQDSSGNLVLVSGLVAEAQEAKHFVSTARGEMIHDTRKGVPFWPLSFGSQPSIPQFEAAIRQRLSQSPDVIEVVSVEASQVSDTLVYTAFIRTASGVSEINGGL